jgi:hypothetical protein
MPGEKPPSKPSGYVAPLTIEELEDGLRAMNELGAERGVFWDENVAAFRQTVLLAIRDTSDALLSPTIPLRWREELDGQLQELLQHLELAERHIAAGGKPIASRVTH